MVHPLGCGYKHHSYRVSGFGGNFAHELHAAQEFEEAH
jgi:hypothetical protein